MQSDTFTLAEIIDAAGLTMEAEWVPENPAMADNEWAHYATHYRVTLRNPVGATMALHYSMGPAHTDPPTLELVLNGLAADISSVKEAPDFIDWAEDLGYEDMREARAAHATITCQGEELAAIMPSGTFDALLWNTERL